MASQLIGTYEGQILAEDFGVGEPTDDFPVPYAYGTLAGIGWGCRFSVPSDKMEPALRDTLLSGADVPVIARGKVAAKKTYDGVDFSLKLTSVVAASTVSSNGAKARVSADA
jgi:hypothetical protein